LCFLCWRISASAVKNTRGVMNGNPGEKIHTNPTFFS
jgi:hypothetical protein